MSAEPTSTPAPRPARATGRATGRAAQRAERRERLLDAVADAVRRHGAQTSMDVIAGEVGVAKPILYRYFQHRQGLVLALAERFIRSLVAEMDAALDEGAGLAAGHEELLATTIDAYLAFVEREPALYRFLTRWAQHEAPSTVAGLQATMARRIGDVLRARLEEEGFDSAPAEPWGFGIVGMVHLAGDWWLEHPQRPRDWLVDQLTTLLWGGLSGYDRRP